ncbi:hypothetical protein [Pseudomonas sp. NPDC087336]|uniref:hypothetical protein n=1 Tax=Pseudomonas sp. NPDC087336 TaxID=3364436 RepID=UPI0037FF08DB
MTTAAERYLQATRRKSTTRRYLQAVAHFEVGWGGFLPASSDSIVRYLAEYADALSISTLRGHLATLARWHLKHGFLDPTKAPQVRDVLRVFRRCTRARSGRPNRCNCANWNSAWRHYKSRQRRQSWPCACVPAAIKLYCSWGVDAPFAVMTCAACALKTTSSCRAKG